MMMEALSHHATNARNSTLMGALRVGGIFNTHNELYLKLIQNSNQINRDIKVIRNEKGRSLMTCTTHKGRGVPKEEETKDDDKNDTTCKYFVMAKTDNPGGKLIIKKLQLQHKCVEPTERKTVFLRHIATMLEEQSNTAGLLTDIAVQRRCVYSVARNKRKAISHLALDMQDKATLTYCSGQRLRYTPVDCASASEVVLVRGKVRDRKSDYSVSASLNYVTGHALTTCSGCKERDRRGHPCIHIMRCLKYSCQVLKLKGFHFLESHWSTTDSGLVETPTSTNYGGKDLPFYLGCKKMKKIPKKKKDEKVSSSSSLTSSSLTSSSASSLDSLASTSIETAIDQAIKVISTSE